MDYQTNDMDKLLYTDYVATTRKNHKILKRGNQIKLTNCSRTLTLIKQLQKSRIGYGHFDHADGQFILPIVKKKIIL